MPNGEEKLKLTDLIDIDFLQKLQDTFAKAVGVASLTIDDKGPITQRSNFSEFCTNFILACERGAQRCNESDIEGGKMAFDAGEPVIYTCHDGLGHFAVPIIVAGQHIASIIGGQFAFKKPDERHFKNLAKELRISNEREYIKALRKIKTHTREHIQFAADLLFLVSNAISEIAYKNLEFKNINKKERFYREIIDAIRSSLDINETLFLICEATVKFFNVQRATISEAPKINYGDKPFIRMEYKTITQMQGSEILVNMTEISEYYSSIVETGEILAIDNISESDAPDFFKESYIAIGVKSLLVIPIQKEEKWGILILSEYNNYRHWGSDEIEIAKSIASQIYIAIRHAETYEQEKKIAQRESILRKLIETIRSSLDIDEIKNIMVEEICKVLGANRCFIIEYDKDSDKFLPVKNEYLTSIDVKSAIGFDLNKKAKHLEEMNREGKEVILPDVETFIKENNLYNTPAEKHFREYDVKSGFSVPISYQNELLGILAVHHTMQEKAFDYEEVELIRTLSNQIAIAIHQAKLYDQEKKTSAKEVTLRETIKIIRSTLDLEKIRNYFLDVACTYFGADRCIFDEYDKEKKEFLPFRIERLKGDDIKSLIGVSVEEDFPEFADKLKNKKRNIIIKDVEKTLARKKLPNYKAIQTLYGSDAKSDYGFIVQYQNEILGILILHYVKNKKVFTTEELGFLKILRDQAGIALHQAELFDKSESQAKREALLREIAEKIRRSLNIEETLSFICEETARLFNVQRTAITSFPHPDNYELFIVRKEYKYWQDMEGFGFKEHSAKAAAYWAQVLIEKEKVLAINNVEESDTPDYFKSTYGEMGIKALIGTAIRKGDDVWGTLVLSEYNNYRHWDEDEKTLLKTIADQIYIAINQAELYEKSQKKAENERILREIMLASVQTFDMKTMIKSLVTEAGKLFAADRCFFIEVDTETNTNLPIQDYAEYLSSENLVSASIRPPTKEETTGFVQRTRQKLFEYCNDINKEELPEATKKFLIDELLVKSYLNVPVFYGDICYGAFVFHYVKNYRQFSEDDVQMAMAIANQSAVILHQAELFELTKMQAEREKISKNIIEILRSTLDKGIIKRLFVKNIGQFLNADRVIFSEFNPEIGNYNPVGVDSEYLSEPDIKSFVGYDWSCTEAQEFIQPILEKRELHIYNWHEYIQGNYKGQDFINLFESMGTQSSYSFPVMYQQRIMGFFSIGFVKRVRRLSDEDINRIRSICTQAGIALYHAHLYEDAQKSVLEHDKFVNKLSTELNEPLNLIADFSSIKSRHELECAEEIEHLNTINTNAKKLLYFLEDVTKSMKKLNLE